MLSRDLDGSVARRLAVTCRQSTLRPLGYCLRSCTRTDGTHTDSACSYVRLVKSSAYRLLAMSRANAARPGAKRGHARGLAGVLIMLGAVAAGQMRAATLLDDRLPPASTPRTPSLSDHADNLVSSPCSTLHCFDATSRPPRRTCLLIRRLRAVHDTQ